VLREARVRELRDFRPSQLYGVTQRGNQGQWVYRDNEDFAAHVDYVHINPVKHRHVVRVADWPWSSFHDYVRRGMLAADWAGGANASLDESEPVG
jgi:hypothetical protein